MIEKKIEQEQTWECYTLSRGDLEAVAERKGLSLEGIDLDDVIHYIKKGISWALDNRDEIIEEAIKSAGKDREIYIKQLKKPEDIIEVHRTLEACSESERNETARPYRIDRAKSGRTDKSNSGGG